MNQFDPSLLKNLYIPPSDSHKGQNGKLMVIGGSHLFHAASLWALSIGSKLVDMVFYASVTENNEIVQKAKEEFRNGIVVPREHIEDYIQEADCVLIGPGMVRAQQEVSGSTYQVVSISDISKIEDEGIQTHYLTKYLLEKYPHKKWVIDAGALQMMSPEWLKQLNGNVILTPHQGEFEKLFRLTEDRKQRTENREQKTDNRNLPSVQSVIRHPNSIVSSLANEYNCIILLKGPTDIVCSPQECVEIPGGNAGMTKGGTGDVLAGLVAGLACKNDLWLAARAGAYLNKKAGERLEKKGGFAFNASDLINEIPYLMKELL